MFGAADRGAWTPVLIRGVSGEPAGAYPLGTVQADPGAQHARASVSDAVDHAFRSIAARADLEETAADLMEVVSNGTVRIPVSQTYALKDAARAHSDLEGRMTTGASVLIP